MDVFLVKSGIIGKHNINQLLVDNHHDGSLSWTIKR